MKRYAIHFKNIAAFLMLLALISLLLPFGKITTAAGTSVVSGIEVVKIGANMGYEYYKNGAIDNDYVLTDDLTWGDVKAGADYASQQNQMNNIIIGGIVCALPIVFCFFAMLFTLIAEGIKTMVLPTLFLMLTVLQSIVMILGFPSAVEYILSQTGVTGIDATLLIGIYAFTGLCIVSLVIILFLWFTGGFNQPESRDHYSDRGDDNEKDKTRKNKKSSWLDGRRKKNRKKHKKSSKKKNKNKKNKDSSNKKNTLEDKNEDNSYDNSKNITLSGHITGLTGMYQGVDIELLKNGTNIFTIGTTPEAMNTILHGTMDGIDKLNGCNCMINFNEKSKQYEIVSHSIKDIILKIGSESTNQIILKHGTSATVGTNTVLYIEEFNSSLRLN